MNDRRFKLPSAAVQLASGDVLIAGGSKSVEVYDPVANKFLLAAGQLDEPRHFMTETQLPNGSVLLAGGYPDNDQTTAATWLYQPQP